MTEIRQGGLMRCCIATIEACSASRKDYQKPAEGQRLQCMYCESSEIVFHDGAWQWENAPWQC